MNKEQHTIPCNKCFRFIDSNIIVKKYKPDDKGTVYIGRCEPNFEEKDSCRGIIIHCINSLVEKYKNENIDHHKQFYLYIEKE